VNPIRDGYDWPQARGVNGLGSAVPIDQPVVDALAKGRFVWKSEARWPVFYTGAGSPIVAGDKVILNIYLPAGEKLYAGRVGRKYNTEKHKGMEDHGRYSHDYRGLREADDVVFCIDAKTGLTLWKAVRASSAGSRASSCGTGRWPRRSGGGASTGGRLCWQHTRWSP